MAARLKVFEWSDGFHSWTVATSSRPKALQAWNVEQDLFKSGLAHEIGDGPERDAALAAPGTVIKTGIAIDVGKIEFVKLEAKRETARRQKARSRVAEIQARIDALGAETQAKLDALQAERDGIDERIADVEAERDKTASKLKRTLQAAKSST